MAATGKRITKGEPEGKFQSLTRSGAGDLTYTLTCHSNGECILLGASIRNKDTVARVATIEILDSSDNVLLSLASDATLAADGTLTFVSNNSLLSLSDGEKLRLKLASVADTQDADFAIKYRYVGEAPTFASVDGS